MTLIWVCIAMLFAMFLATCLFICVLIRVFTTHFNNLAEFTKSVGKIANESVSILDAMQGIKNPDEKESVDNL
ncbi:MAG: hypothetical protein HQK96_07020 [Nitrospirae bacterium]|nr:hypothetical protein [Nitrospirota bacterium]